MESDGSDDVVASGLKTYRACDYCRVRKVKCDERDPCTQCTQARKECKRTRIRKQREKKQRVLVSAQYEKKIDVIDERLNTLTELLRQRTSGLASPQNSIADQVANAGGSTAVPTPLDSSNQPDPTFEGESSFSAHSRLADSLLEQALKKTPGGSSTLSGDDTLGDLRRLASIHRKQPEPNDSYYEYALPMTVPPTKLALPPFQTVANLLKAERENPRMSSIFSCIGSMNIDTLTQYCMDTYFSATCSPAVYCIAVGYLLWLFNDRGVSVTDRALKDDYKHQQHLCSVALDTTLSRLPLHLPLSSEYVHCLLVGACNALASSKASLARTLICKASEMCQSLGYHRVSTMRDDSDETRRKKLTLFWGVYVTDKGLALRLGRASSIQDYDVSVPTESPLCGPASNEHFRKYLQLWVTCARIQGNVYERLYSPYALSLSSQAREIQAQSLMGQIREIRSQLDDCHNDIRSTLPVDLYDNMFLSSDYVAMCTISTLVHRAIPPPPGSNVTFSANCVNSAREALKSHETCVEMLGPASDSGLLEGYINWVLLYTPFLPFIVVFSNVIETGSAPDLKRLHAFVASLQTATEMSGPVEKLTRLSQILCNIAQRIVELHSSPNNNIAATGNNTNSDDARPQSAQALGVDSSSYLNALGFAPSSFQQPYGDNSTETDISMAPELSTVLDNGLFDTNDPHYGEWMQDHQQMLDLIQEDDLQLFGMNFFRDVGHP